MPRAARDVLRTSSMTTNELRTERRTLDNAMGPPLVLLAEDDDAIRTLIAAVLRADGHAVVEVSSGIGMLAQVRSLRRASRSPSAIVCDIQMPGMSGLRALALLRTETLGIPILVVTAHGEDENRREAERLGASAVLGKPFELRELRRAVRALIGRPSIAPPAEGV